MIGRVMVIVGVMSKSWGVDVEGMIVCGSW